MYPIDGKYEPELSTSEIIADIVQSITGVKEVRIEDNKNVLVWFDVEKYPRQTKQRYHLVRQQLRRAGLQPMIDILVGTEGYGLLIFVGG